MRRYPPWLIRLFAAIVAVGVGIAVLLLSAFFFALLTVLAGVAALWLWWQRRKLARRRDIVVVRYRVHGDDNRGDSGA